ncbi:TonB-dependent receptor plug domain-containing protein [Luteimonas saliphila]|uniref:TonB-dependent receptor plug domain-containing protein n=1 Tax=Luteimonas saliphila TaxID=2804919 RepID=UPI00192E1DD8|nr:TonB-dependent receptor [Luteimonas saliphila]
MAMIAGMASFGAAVAAQAQETAPADSAQEDEQVAQLDTVRVTAPTGSRIMREGYDAPTPVTVASSEDLLRVTPTGIPDGLNKLPQFQNSSGPARSSHNFSNSAAHGNILNLRGVGGNRSLILFDGLRVAPTTYQGAVDVDVLPTELLSRVDVVTAGASAAYGSDAVAGVVNFVLDRGFLGVRGSAQYGESERGDNEHHKISLAGGWSVLGDAGHVLLSAEYSKSDGMLRGDRSMSNYGYNHVGAMPGAGAPGSAANPYVLARDININGATYGGLIQGGALNGYRFLPDGTLTPFDPGTPTGTPNYNQGGDGYTIPADVTAVSPLESKKAFGRFSYDFDNGITAYAQGLFSRNETSYITMANAFVGPSTPARIALDNPYLNLTADQRTAVEAAGESRINVSTYSTYAPRPQAFEQTDFWMANAGLEGRFGETWNWQAGLTRGESDHVMENRGLLSWREAYAAIDAVRDGDGNIVCRATLSADPVIRDRFANCQPLNVLGEGSMLTTPNGYDYATGTSRYRARIITDSATFSLGGELFQLPAGPVDAAFGAEFRRQELKLTSNANPGDLDTPDERAEYFYGVDVPASALFYWLTNVGVADGKVNVKEAFTEWNFPLLRDVPGASSLDLNMAGRFTDYSTSGSVTTWKVGTTWRPVEDLLVRATVSRDIRAPTLFDLFAGDQSGIGQLVDPVTGITSNVVTMTGGNRDLKPEEADTLSIGAVLSPSAWPAFTVAVDYYRLKIDGAIGTLGTSQIVQNCHASGGTAPECALITRPSPNEFPTLVRTAPANIASLETSGVDIDASWRTTVGPGDLTLRLYASYLDSYQTQQSATAPVYEYAGTGQPGAQPVARPKWRGNLGLNYEVGDLGLSLSQQYVGGFRLGSDEPNQIYEDDDRGSVSYTDLTASYRFPRQQGVEMFFTVNNLFDRDPPLIPGNVPGVNLPTIISVYDTIGRAYTLGLRFKF